jgi:hypothetical protein
LGDKAGENGNTVNSGVTMLVFAYAKPFVVNEELSF